MKTELPDSSEWDFRSVPEWELCDCIRWEYARETKKLRASICAVLDSQIDGKTARQWLKVELNGRTKFHQRAARNQSEISEQIARACPTEELAWLVDCLPDFPAPWLQIEKPKWWRGAGLSANIQPLRPWLTNHKNPRHPDAVPDNYFLLEVDFAEARNLETIVEDFREWLTAEAKRRNFERPKGKLAAPPWSILKDLSALRISRSKSFSEAGKFLRKYISSTPVDSHGDTLPIYSGPNKWSEAAKRARDLVSRIECSP